MAVKKLSIPANLCAGVLLAAIIAPPSAILASLGLDSFLAYRGFAGATNGLFIGGIFSACIYGLVCATTFSIKFGHLVGRQRLVRGLFLGLLGGSVFSIFWISHSVIYDAGILPFVGYSAMWGAIDGLIFSWLFAVPQRLFGIRKPTPVKLDRNDRNLIISSAIAIIAAIIPIVSQFALSSGEAHKAFLIIATYEKCPTSVKIDELHGLSNMGGHSQIGITINQNYAAMLGPFDFELADTLSRTHKHSGRLPKDTFLLNANHVVSLNVTCSH